MKPVFNGSFNIFIFIREIENKQHFLTNFLKYRNRPTNLLES